MSMEIRENYNSRYLEELQVKKQEESAKAVEAAKEEKKELIPIPEDEYISSEQAGSKPTGLYHLGQDENGNPKVIYDKPKKTDKNEKRVQLQEEPAKKTEECTGNTDVVDREIEKLKEDKKGLEQQIRSAAGNEKKVKELKKKLQQVEQELSQKDNDSYKRQMKVNKRAVPID